MAAQVWAPNDAAVAQICTLLTEFQSPTADQAQVRGASYIVDAGHRNRVAGGRSPASLRGGTRLRHAPPQLGAALPHNVDIPGFAIAQVWQNLEQARHVPDFNNYLSYIFSKGESLPSDVSVQRLGQRHRLARVALAAGSRGHATVSIAVSSRQ